MPRQKVKFNNELVQRARKARGTTTTTKSRINAFPKYLVEFGVGVLVQLHTSINKRKSVMVPY